MPDAELKLAIEDATYGPRIKETRVLPPKERSKERRLRKLKETLEKARALAGDDEETRELRARLETAMDDTSELRKLEERYVSKEQRIRWGEWVHGEGAYATHDEADAILAFVVETYRPELKFYRIAVVFQEKVPPSQRKERMGTAMKLPGKMAYLSDCHGVITLGWDHWIMLTDRDRQRLVHHELEHLEVDEGLKLRGHDFEDFASIVGLYGLRSESERFSTDGPVADVLAGGSQIELLERVG
ncbi:MAG: putative metallopeptidase [Gemmatimonadota bacterium]